MDRSLVIDHHRRTLKAVIDALQGNWKAAPGRDRREPGLEEKRRAEERMTLITLRILRKQRERLLAQLAAEHPERKALTVLETLDLEDDDPFIMDLIEHLIKMVKGGIALFGRTVKPAIDYTLTNAEAARKAAEYAYELVKGITETTKAALQDVITRFVETPGMTIGDIEREIVDIFGPARAEMIAVTETTRAYATGNQMAGEALRDEFPGVRVVKTWFTNNDDIVCNICRPLNGEEVEINEVWTVDGEDYDNPPAHVNCRCWTETSTALAEQ